MRIRTLSTTSSPGGYRRIRRASRANAWRTGGRSTTGRATMSEAARRDGAEEETAMVIAMKRSGALILRLIVGLALLGWPRVGSAQGTCYENRIPGPVQARGTPTAPLLSEAAGR